MDRCSRNMSNRSAEDKVNPKNGKEHKERTHNEKRRNAACRDRSRSPVRRKPEVAADDKPENVALGARNRLKSVSNQMKLSAQKARSSKPKLSVATAFNQDSDDEPEEMPPEARMRMRNIGRDTPTSSGPNSFGKTKQGFSDAKKVYERNLREAMDNVSDDD